MIGMDTTAIIDLFKEEPGIIEVLQKNTTPIASTQINYLELLFGIDLPKQAHRDEKKYYDDFFSELTVLPLDQKACEKAAEIFWSASRTGKTMGKFDAVIAGIFLTQGVTKILTRNQKQFTPVPGITVIPY